MRKRVSGIVLAGAVAAVFGAARVDAQIVEPLKFTTTFAFTAGHVTFPAGTYTLRPMDLDATVMEISNGSITTFFSVEPTGERLNDKTPDEVVFKKAGEAYVLSRVWDASERAGVETISAPTDTNHRKHHHLG